MVTEADVADVTDTRVVGGSTVVLLMQLAGRATKPVRRPVVVMIPAPTTMAAMNTGSGISNAVFFRAIIL